jgi:hypothetical protein
VGKKAASEAWRKLMTSDELESYDAWTARPASQCSEKYRSRDSQRVSRQKNEVEYNPDFMQHQPGSRNFDGTFRQATTEDENQNENTSRQPINKIPSDPTQAKLLAEAIPALADVPATCFICGEGLKDGRQDRVTMLIHSAGRDDTAVYCKPCFDEKNVLPLRTGDDWHSKVSPLHLEIAERRAQGETYEEIGKVLALDRKKVSRMFAEVKSARKAAGNRRPP